MLLCMCCVGSGHTWKRSLHFTVHRYTCMPPKIPKPRRPQGVPAAPRRPGRPREQREQDETTGRPGLRQTPFRHVLAIWRNREHSQTATWISDRGQTSIPQVPAPFRAKKLSANFPKYYCDSKVHLLPTPGPRETASQPILRNNKTRAKTTFTVPQWEPSPANQSSLRPA